MTLVEFLHPLRGHSLRDLGLATLYFEQRYSQNDAITVEELRAFLKRAHIPGAAKANLADVLAKSAPYVDASGKKGHRILWSLTATGQDLIRDLLALPKADLEVEHDISSLEKVVSSISDKHTSDYLREAITCLQAGALRATVVFVWAGAVNNSTVVFWLF